MAHHCPKCYSRCHCGGDIEDLTFEDTVYETNCTCCNRSDDEEDEYEGGDYDEWVREQNIYRDILGY